VTSGQDAEILERRLTISKEHLTGADGSGEHRFNEVLDPYIGLIIAGGFC